MKNIKKAPIKFHPYLKSVIWGGNKICEYKKISQPQPNIGESWEISAIPGCESIVAEGEYVGSTINQLIERFGEQLLGKEVKERYEGKFPLLVKLIDANDNLSVQVHPDDSLAMKRHGCMGKTEMWYVIHTEKGAKIYSGLNRTLTPEDYDEIVRNNEIESVLAVHDSSPDDLFFLPSGRVHAIGAGNLLAEIQESSDITYRIYDYNRKDASGNTRELHTELAKEAIDFQYHDDYKGVPVPEDVEECELASCRHFTTHRLKISGDKNLDLPDDSFLILMCLKGKVNLEYKGGETILPEGHTVFLPAVMKEITLRGEGILLSTKCSTLDQDSDLKS